MVAAPGSPSLRMGSWKGPAQWPLLKITGLESPNGLAPAPCFSKTTISARREKGDNQRTNQNDLDIALSWPQRTAIEKIDCLNLHPGRTAPKTIAQNPISVHESHKPPSSLPTAPCLPSLRPTAGTALGDLTSAFEHEVSSPSVPATPAPAWNLRDALRGGHQDFTVPDVRILNVEYLLAVFRHLQLSFCEIPPSVASREMRNSNTSGP